MKITVYEHPDTIDSNFAPLYLQPIKNGLQYTVALPAFILLDDAGELRCDGKLCRLYRQGAKIVYQVRI